MDFLRPPRPLFGPANVDLLLCWGEQSEKNLRFNFGGKFKCVFFLSLNDLPLVKFLEKIHLLGRNTMWKFQSISITQILREIKVGVCAASKSTL